METTDLIGITINREFYCKVKDCPEYLLLKTKSRSATDHSNIHKDTDSYGRKKDWKCDKCPSFFTFTNDKQFYSHMDEHESKRKRENVENKIEEEKKTLLIFFKAFKDMFDIEYNKDKYIEQIVRIMKNRNYSEQQTLWFKKRFSEAVEYVKYNAIKNIEIPTNIFDAKKHIELNYLKKIMLNSSVDLNKDLMNQPEALKTLRNIILNEMHTILTINSFRGINAFVADNSYNYAEILYYIENYRKKLVESFAYIAEPRVNVEDVINFLVEMQREKEKETANILVGMKRKRGENYDEGNNRRKRSKRSKSRRKKTKTKTTKNKRSKSKRKKGKSRRKKTKTKTTKNKRSKSKRKKGKSRRKKSKY